MENIRQLTLILLITLITLGGCTPATPAPEDTLVVTEPPMPTDTQVPPTETVTEVVPTDTPVPPETPTEAIPTDTATPRPQRTPITFKVENDIQYGATQNQMLDVYQPQIEGQVFPTLLLIHGSGLSKFYMIETAEYFARQGYAVVSFNRGLGTYPRSELDSFCALAWVHANAETYSFDPQRVVPVGFSLGGALAAFLGTVDDPGMYMGDCPHALPEGDYIRTVVTVAGFFDYEIWIPGAKEDGLIYTYFGPPNEHMDEIREASPVNWVDGSEPPFLLVHGENDGTVDPAQSQQFAALLSESGVIVELLILPNLVHDQITTSPRALIPVKDYLADLFAE